MGIESPYVLLGMVPFIVIALAVSVYRHRFLRRTIGRYGDISILYRLFLIRLLLVISVLFGLIFALSGPYFIRSVKVDARGAYVILLNDESLSMTARLNEKSASRLEREKVLAHSIVESLQRLDANISVCEFTSRIFCRAPFGSSRERISEAIDLLGPDAFVGYGSDITGSLRKLAVQFPNGASRKIIILLSDGGDDKDLRWEAYREEQRSVLIHLAEEGISIVSVGIGETTPIPVALRQITTPTYRGEYSISVRDGKYYEVVTTALLEEKMKYIAQMTGGIYLNENDFSVSGDSQVADILNFDRIIVDALRSVGALKREAQSASFIGLLFSLTSCFLYKLFFG